MNRKRKDIPAPHLPNKRILNTAGRSSRERLGQYGAPGVILGPEEGHPMGTVEQLAEALQLDPKLYEYCLRRTSPYEIFNILKENPPLLHARIVRESLERATAQMQSV